jgi:hypothetical protein
MNALSERGLTDDDIAFLLAALLHAAEAQAEAAAFFRFALTRHYKTRHSAHAECAATEWLLRTTVHAQEPWLPLTLLDVLAQHYRETFHEIWDRLEQEQAPRGSPAGGPFTLPRRRSHLQLVPKHDPGGGEDD